MMVRVQKGFSLIELMIVVAIIGILSLMAYPAYQDYTIRTYVAETLQQISPIKTEIIENYVTQGNFSTYTKGTVNPMYKNLVSGNTPVGNEEDDAALNKYTMAVFATDNEINIMFHPKLSTYMGIAGYDESMIPFTALFLRAEVVDDNNNEIGSIRWKCYTYYEGWILSVKFKYLPPSCRNYPT